MNLGILYVRMEFQLLPGSSVYMGIGKHAESGIIFVS